MTDNPIDKTCDYCDTSFTIYFDREDDELIYCPTCGEHLLSDDDDFETGDLFDDED